MASRGGEPLTQRRRPAQAALRAAAAAAGLLVSAGGFAFIGALSGGSFGSCGGRLRHSTFSSAPSAATRIALPRGARPWQQRARVQTFAATTETRKDMRQQAAEAHLERLRDLAERGLADKAEDALYDMIDAGGKPEAAHFGAVISSCAPGVDTERAERWLFRMKALQVAPDSGLYHALMRVAAEAGNPSQAEEWMKESWKEGHEPDLTSFALMLKALRKAGDTANVESWFERLMDTGLQPDIACVNEIIGLFAEQKNMVKAAEWFAIAEQSLGLAPDVETYKSIIGAYSTLGDIEEAERLVDKMLQQGIRPQAEIYTLLTGDGRSARPFHVVEHWSQRLVDDGLEIDSDAYTAVIGAWAAAGNAQRAEEWFSRMLEDGMATAEALALLVDALMLSGGVDKSEIAEEWIDQFVETGQELTPAVYAARASADVYSGDFEQVEARMQQMEMSGLEMNEDCLTVLLLAYANAKPQQTLLAEQMFKQQMLRGKMRATREVLEALRAAVGGARCLSLRRELQIGTSSDASPSEAVDTASMSAAAKQRTKPRKRRVWKQFKPPEPPVQSLKWE